MTDRELLKDAAKAAGIDTTRCLQYADGALYWPGKKGRWNPLADDGDAFRLQVKLHLDPRQFPILDDGMGEPLGMVEVWRVDDDDPLHVEFLRSGDDRPAATRRAIVRAAAEIGRGMK